MKNDITVIGAGIVGLATAWALRERFPDKSIVVLDKESTVAAHQTGHNSGVIHSGIYYAPGSLKATLTHAGRQSLEAFCRQYGVPYSTCGKLIVATKPDELPGLKKLYERGRIQGLNVSLLSNAAIREYEPCINGLQGIHVPETGVVDYVALCNTLAGSLTQSGVLIKLNCRLNAIQQHHKTLTLQTTQGDISTHLMVNCAGLFSDRIARFAGLRPDAKIIPFRGEYYDLSPRAAQQVRGLIYPVPNPAFPFLGVHLTRGIHQDVHAGPNAVLSLKREGYQKFDISVPDTLETLFYPGFLKLAAKYYQEGWQEMQRSWFKARFLKSVQALLPDLTTEDLIPGPSGVRAQAVAADGRLVDDFLILKGPQAIHVCNAPSPAATAALEIGRYIAQQIEL